MRLDRLDKRIAGGLVILVIIGLFSIPAFIFGKKYLDSKKQTNNIVATENSTQDETGKETPAATPEPETKPEVKEEIKKAPPKRAVTPKTAVSTTTNADGTQTSTLSEGGIPKNEVEEISELPPVSASPYSVRFSDETGINSSLDKTLKDYLNSKLRWSGEISYLYQITVRNAGDTGWEGQYAGSYKTDRSGKIVSAFGYIVLNTYYHQSSPNFTDYMKLVLSHEYGHHYTLYHKWVDMNLTNSVRFPDSYYNIRPLSKATTAVDYSLGWQNCEAEIIAEDYSYFYSGYGYHAMAAEYGYSYPSAGTKTWISSLAAASIITTPETPPVTPTDNPPIVTITSPANNASVSGTINITANASDDKGVLKVEFLVNGSLVGTDTSAPYSVELNASSYAAGDYQIAAKAYDAMQNVATTITLKFIDTTAPTGTITPSDNPYSWSDNRNLEMSVTANDNTRISMIKLYINDGLQGEVPGTSGAITVSFTLAKSMPSGTYNIKIEIIDSSNNIGVLNTTVNRS